MVKKVHKTGPESGEAPAQDKSAAQLADTIKDSAQQIWLAGLGAFSKAQEEGSKVFEKLVTEGVSLQRKTQSAAEDKLADATTRMASMATDMSSKATGQWDKLENIFEERVSRAMKKLGVPSARDLEALIERVERLEKASVGAAPAAPRKVAARTAPAAKKAPAAKRPARKTV